MPAVIRPYDGRDETALLALWNEALPYDGIDPATFRRKVLCDPNVGAGFLVAEQARLLAGFCLGIRRREPFGPQDLEPGQAWITMFAVASNLRRQGVATALFEAVEAWARGSGAARLALAPYVPNYFIPGLDTVHHAAAIAFLERRGYALGSEALALDTRLVNLDLAPDRARLAALAADGVSIATPSAEQLPALLRFLEREAPYDWLRAGRERLAAGRLEDFTVAVADQQVIGYCQNEGEHFGPFGVAEPWRGRGIGTAVLAHRLDRMRAAGHHHAWVLWTSQETADRVYARFGFALTRRFRLLSKALAEPLG